LRTFAFSVARLGDFGKALGARKFPLTHWHVLGVFGRRAFLGIFVDFY